MRRARFSGTLAALTLSLCLLLSVSVTAAENILVPVPAEDVPVLEIKDTPENTGTSPLYLPLSYKLPDRNEELRDSQAYTLPRLTNHELERIRGFMEDRKAGKEIRFTDLHCAEKTEDVSVGVYRLDPADFDGETFYVILPAASMNDDMLLSLLSAFEELGIPFDPDGLSERNCQRGNWYEHATRGLSSEENERMETILRQVRRGMLGPEKVPEGTYCRYADSTGVYLDEGQYRTAPYRFSFYPYRRMTDEELAAFALAADGVWETDPDLQEKQALDFVSSTVKAPLSVYVEKEYREQTDSGLMYYCHLRARYTDRRTGRETWPEGEPYEFVVTQKKNAYTERTKPFALTVNYCMPSGTEAPEDSPVRTGEEWNSIALEWAKKNLKLPEGEIPEKWGSEEELFGATGAVRLNARAGNLSIFLVVNRQDAGVSSCYIFTAGN